MSSGREPSLLLLALLACRAVGPKPRGWCGRRWAIEQVAHLIPDMEAAIAALEGAGVVDVLRTANTIKFRLNRQGVALSSALDLNIARMEVLRLINRGTRC